jgi:hypothetical protein
MCGAVHILPLHAFMARTGTPLPLLLISDLNNILVIMCRIVPEDTDGHGVMCAKNG